MIMFRKSLFLKLFATFMSLLVLIGTIGIQADFHICQGNIKTFSFWGNAQKCSPMELKTACEHNFDHTITKKKCCNDEEMFNSTSFQTEFSARGSVNKSFEVALNAYVSNHVLKIAPTVATWTLPPPPLIGQQKSLIIAFQQYLI